MPEPADQSAVILITGAASGIGRHLATAMLARGHRVTAADINYSGLVRTFAGDSALPQERLTLFPLDVRRPADWHAALDHNMRAFGRLDYLFNVAGVIMPGYIDEIDPAQIDLHVDINVKGVMYGTRVAAKQMIRQGGGHIINVASLAGIAPVPGISLYSASKFAVRGFSLAVAAELRPKGVHVSVINPDVVATPMLDLQLDYPEAALTFSGSRTLTVADVEAAFLAVMRRRPLECTIPFDRGILATVANVFPAVSRLLEPMLIARGSRRADRLRLEHRTRAQRQPSEP